MSSASKTPPAAGTSPASGRLLSLDVFRGITILAMILVNNPGDWDEMYWPLAHAKWHGWTPTDLIFPFFLFIVGAALAYSLRKYRDGTHIDPAVYWRILRRTLLLIFLGWLPTLLHKTIAAFYGEAFDLGNLRIFGVLVRIALVYFCASLIVLRVPLRAQFVLAVAILLGYWGALVYLPTPGQTESNLSPAGNLVRMIDLDLIGPDHMYYDHAIQFRADPEGLLSTFPAIVTALLGYWSGLFIQRRGANYHTVASLAACGLVLAVVGLGWDYLLPINKKLWTSSFVLLTGGLAMVMLAGCLLKFDVWGWRRLARPYEIVGINAIFVFVASGLVSMGLSNWQVNGGSAKSWLYHHLFTSWIHDPKLSSLAMALATVAFWWFICWLMSLRGWSIRV